MMLVSLRRLPLCIALLLLAMSINGVACSGRLHIEVKEAGVYGLDYAAIVAQQPELADCMSQDLALFNRGKEVPIRVQADDQGRFVAGSRIEWIGQALHGSQSWYDQYSAVNVYMLAAGSGAHSRMREVPPGALAGKPAALRRTRHFEQENLMLRLSDRQMNPGEEPDVWQWAKLTPIDAQPFSYDFDLPDLNLMGVDQREVNQPYVDLTKPETHTPDNDEVALTLNFRGVSNVIAMGQTLKPMDHVVELSLNGKRLASFEWDGRDEMRRVLSVARRFLREQGNTISLRIPRRPAPNDPQNFIVDVAMFNWMEVTYPVRGNLVASRASFRVTADAAIELSDKAGINPQLYGSDGAYRTLAPLGNARFRAAGASADVELYPLREGQALSPSLVRAVAQKDLRLDAVGDDYVIVAHPRLLQAIQPLAQYHYDHGHTVTVVNVEDVYDQFNDGIIHPVAIRNLVAWGTEHWTIKPRYLLLVGDASADIHHDVRTDHHRSSSYALRPEPVRDELLMPGGLSSMPSTSYTQWDPDLPNRNLIPTWQFPSFEGQAASDNGFVALTPGDFHPQLAVGRFPVVAAAEVTTIVNKTIAYLSKPTPGPWHRDVTFISTDEVASFKEESDKIASDLGKQGFAVKSIYTKLDAKEAITAHAELKSDLDAGNLLVHFLGHGGAFIWRVGPPADLFTLDDISHLRNAGRYPMVLAMTCFSAPFDNPTEDSIGERFLRESDKGAVAVFAASWSNSPNPENSQALIKKLLEPGESIGDAIVATKAQNADRVFVEMYNLLGDPAIVLTRPNAQLAFMRTDDHWNPQIVVRVPAPDFGGDVDVDWIDAQGKILASQHYQLRDNQFFLSPLDKATQVRVYLADARNGLSAFGSFNWIDQPKLVVNSIAAKPAVSEARSISQNASQSGLNPVQPAALAVRSGRQPDTIAQANFDAAPAEPVPDQPRKANHPTD